MLGRAPKGLDGQSLNRTGQPAASERAEEKKGESDHTPSSFQVKVSSNPSRKRVTG